MKKVFTVKDGQGTEYTVTRTFGDFWLFDTMGFSSYHLLDGRRIRINRHFTISIVDESSRKEEDKK